MSGNNAETASRPGGMWRAYRTGLELKSGLDRKRAGVELDCSQFPAWKLDDGNAPAEIECSNSVGWIFQLDAVEQDGLQDLRHCLARLLHTRFHLGSFVGGEFGEFRVSDGCLERR